MMSFVPSRFDPLHPPHTLSYPQPPQVSGEALYSQNPSDGPSSLPPFPLESYQQQESYAPAPVSTWHGPQPAPFISRARPERNLSPPPIQAFPSAANHTGLLQVYSFQPSNGGPGTRVSIRTQITTGSSDPNRSVRILFGDQASMAEKILRIGTRGLNFELWVRVPDLGAISSQLVMKAELCDGDGIVRDSIEFGNFDYLNAPGPSQQPSVGERRRREDDLNERNIRPFPLRHPGVPIVPQPPPMARTVSVDTSLLSQPSYHGLPHSISPAPSLGTHPGLAVESPRARVHSAPISTTSGLMWPVGAPGGHSASQDMSPALPGTISQQVSLMRTTQIQAGQGLTTNRALSRVALELQGKLQNCACGWSQEEVHAKRRLVQFQRTLEGASLKVEFKNILPSEFVQGSAVVSCIYREDGGPEERDRCYITSVDTIQLLEALIATPFSVEEKNRIRRNLEGFKPITVSKHKPDQEAFFKLIMEFPAPKPRNIEKDVKVFRWESLDQALAKIVDKYSVMGVMDATAGLVAFPTRSESPSTSDESPVLAGPEDDSNGDAEVEVQHSLKTEPVEPTLSDYAGPYVEAYAPGQLQMRPDSTSPSIHDTSMSMSSSPYINTHPTSTPQFAHSEPVPYYSAGPSANPMLSGGQQYPLQSLSSYDSEPASHVQADLNDSSWSMSDYLTDPPPTAGGSHMTPSGSQGSLNHPNGVDDKDTNYHTLYTQSTPSKPHVTSLPSSGSDRDVWRSPPSHGGQPGPSPGFSYLPPHATSDVDDGSLQGTSS